MAEIRIEIQKEIRGIIPLFLFLSYKGEKNMEYKVIYFAFMALLFVIAILIASIISKIVFEMKARKWLKEIKKSIKKKNKTQD